MRERVYFQGKPVFITNHFVTQARKRDVSPRLIYKTIETGKVQRFGKNLIRFIGKSAVCIAYDTNMAIIKTVGRK